MFNIPRYIQNSFSVIFAPIPDIRRKANSFEDSLKGEYSQPQIIPIPDEFDLSMPRIIFDSKRGVSQIVISPIRIAFHVSYTDDYQIDTLKREKYLIERIPTIFKLTDTIKSFKPYFFGFTTEVHIPCDSSDDEIIKHLSKLFSGGEKNQNLHDFQIKFTRIEQDYFFDNITIENYRIWPPDDTSQIVPRLSRNGAIERGVKLTSDFNNRFAFNERPEHSPRKDDYKRILEKSFNSVKSAVKQTMEEVS